MTHAKKHAPLSLSCVARIVRHGHPHFNVRVEWLFKTGRHYTDYAVWLAVEDQFFRTQILIAIQPFLPHFLVHNYKLLAALPIFTIYKSATDQWAED